MPGEQEPTRFRDWTTFVQRCRRCGADEVNALSGPTECEYGHDWEEVETVPAARVQELEGERDEHFRDAAKMLLRAEEAESHLARLEEAVKEVTTGDYLVDRYACALLNAALTHSPPPSTEEA